MFKLRSLVFCAFLGVLVQEGIAGTQPSQVRTPNGALRGITTSAGTHFLGVPYATAPLGSLRWAPPRPASKWSGIYDATKLRDKCTQLTLTLPRLKEGSEDCLYLNVYAPPARSRDKPLPVMVWFHGGSFVAGSSQDVDAQTFATKTRVIVVTVNYRLGVFGFFASPLLDAESGTGVSGNQGIRDQQLALHWISNNIRGFGGDPTRVTLAGQSAGAWAIWVHLASPATEGLFHQVIGQSWPLTLYPSPGVQDRNRLSGVRSLHEEEERGPSSQLMAAIRCSDVPDKLACARAVETDAVLRAVGADKLTGPGWNVVFDGVLLPDSVVALFARGAYRHIPMLTGFNFREDAFRILAALSNGGNLLSAEQYAAQLQSIPHGEDVLRQYPASAYSSADDAKTALMNDGGACSAFDSANVYSRNHPTYLYEFADPNPVPTLYLVDLPKGVHTGAFHTSEISYVFQTGFPNELRSAPPPFSAAQRALSDRMLEYWGNFVREGRPTSDDVWPSLTASEVIRVLRPDGDLSMPENEFNARHNCTFWRSLR